MENSAPTSSAPQASESSAPASESSSQSQGLGGSLSSSSGESYQQQGAIGAQSQQPTSSEQKALQEFIELQVNGGTHRFSPQELQSLAEYAYQVQSNIGQISERYNKLQELESMISQDPFEALTRSGVDIDTLIAQRLQEYQEIQSLTPEQRELRELRKHYEYEKQERQRMLEERQLEARRREYEIMTQKLYKDIEESCTKYGLPQTPYIENRLAQEILSLQSQGVKGIWVEDLIPEIKKEMETELKAITSTMAPEQLYNFFGEEAMAKLREYDMARLRQGNPSLKPQVKQEIPEAAMKPKIGSWSDFFGGRGLNG